MWSLLAVGRRFVELAKAHLASGIATLPPAI